MGQSARKTIEIIRTVSPDAHSVLELIDKKMLAEAKEAKAKAVRLPAYEAKFLEAMLAYKDGELARALELLYTTAELAPGFEQAIFNLGVLLEEAERFDDALNAYFYLLEFSPKYFQAEFNVAFIYQRAGQVKDAERHYRKVLEQTPYNSQANCNLGAMLINQQRFDEARPYCEKAVMLALDNVEARNNCGIVYVQSGDFAKAEKAFRHALKISPNYAPAKRNLEMLERQKQNPAAVGINRLQEIVTRANQHLAQRQLDEAEAAYREALVINPDIPEVLLNLGTTLNLLARFDEAEAMLKRALSIQPKNAEAFGNLGNLYKDQQRNDDAVAAYRQALALEPDAFEVIMNLGMLLETLGQHEDALALYKKALAISPAKMLEMNPHHSAALTGIILEQQRLCLWDGLEGYCQRLCDMAAREDVDLREGYEGFFVSTLQTVTSDPALQRRHAEQCSALNFGAISRAYDVSRPLPRAGRKGGKLRIGYLSGDFYEHATSYLAAGLFEQHDRSQFEIYAYSYGRDDKSAIRQRIAQGADRFIDLRELSDKAASEQIGKNGIDILVEMKGYTGGQRMGIAAPRPAPLQVHYLGYPSTTGAAFIDYFLADRVVAPEPLAAHFSEKLVWLPHSYQVNDQKRPLPGPLPSRSAHGLPEQGLVFGALNQNYKITPEMFDVWMRLLAATPGSVLWVYLSQEAAADNLRMEASKRGIEPSRLVFATYKPLAEHITRLPLVDLFLDTFPVNAHTTASDALWAGVPVLTRAGQSFTSRVAASLLSAVELPELITDSLQAYEAMALALAADPARLKALREHLVAGRSRFALFDTQATTRAIERAYLAMAERHMQGQLPQAFAVE